MAGGIVRQTWSLLIGPSPSGEQPLDLESRQSPAHLVCLPEMSPGMGVAGQEEFKQVETEVTGYRRGKSKSGEIQAIRVRNPVPQGCLRNQELRQLLAWRTK
jgi:hypothetical protein